MEGVSVLKVEKVSELLDKLFLDVAKHRLNGIRFFIEDMLYEVEVRSVKVTAISFLNGLTNNITMGILFTVKPKGKIKVKESDKR